MENVEFEDKVDLDTLVLPSKPVRLGEIEINDIKQEPIQEENQHTAFESDHDVGKEFKLKMEENILRMYQELDKEKSENSSLDFSLRRSLKIRKFVEKIAAVHVSVDQISFVGLQFAILFLKNVQFFSLFAVLFYSEFILVLKTVCF